MAATNNVFSVRICMSAIAQVAVAALDMGDDALYLELERTAFCIIAAEQEWLRPMLIEVFPWGIV